MADVTGIALFLFAVLMTVSVSEAKKRKVKNSNDRTVQTAPREPSAEVPAPPVNQHISGSSDNTVTDSRRHTVKTMRMVRIGNKTWMAENLDFKTGNSWCYEDSSSNCAKYGRLYDWNTAKKACPSGWRLPAREDWDNLAQAVGGRKNSEHSGIQWDGAGRNLKSKSGWGGKGSGADTHGFSALPGGYRNAGGAFDAAGTSGYWWTASKDDNGAYHRGLFHDDNDLSEDVIFESFGYSVRCVRD